ncbi:dimethyl sulfoxide reductase anchor subunit family protein [Oceanibacterium hippocampi]|uniref:DMSO reductase anchor subunit (DmsC) n=1 Tax=Oceanibacterium hippocampi TaxID=745714 RepID=A0A1Y5U1H6_9PROT|nr:DmsC/YnfH family molybdoenzyme membrane anchor subunit [Oceanibacterium hippocampi]SLN76253.1 DMSO reductase anchor subunit (DmsC) [Oceanibacterium hippocampi]
MHPAYSVIFFTVASGAGLGLQVLLAALLLAGHVSPVSPVILTGLGLAFVLISGGLLSSTFHLGHPERAWRALSQWRSSWLSREGVLAIVAVGSLALLIGSAFIAPLEALRPLGIWGSLLLPLPTIAATAMIYASLKPIPAWRNGWVVPSYLVLALMSGALWLGAITAPFSGILPGQVVFALVSLVAGAVVKLGYWRRVDRPEAAMRATGLGPAGTVRPFDPPHTQPNYLQREMGYRIARKHAGKLRRVAFVAAFVVPLALTLLSIVLPHWPAAGAAMLAAAIATFGLIVERWLFFAEARHVVMQYYEGE